ncbi:paraquat-inducible protein A [Flavimaricola marinus]|uniref:Paraquat-inducible protein A n=1 Tax=Flavimaricola marinus TaxID=1819565 RepID=A0A238LKQ5_9RHOB|nr:paraquat-inducible protein A [Flavimaricola marinus]SMY09536.1 Paraquat-inducible protein A [Flavimaricola marinus]
MSGTGQLAALTAREAGLVGCRRCTRVWPIERTECGRCGASLESRDPKSLSRVWAWWTVGVMFYFPANLYPMLSTRTLLSTSESTIVGGAIDLIHHGSIGIAVVILVASVLIPMAKFLCIAFLALSARRNTDMSAGSRQHLYELVEYVGRWSMIDVFVVAILSALVQLNVAASINPGPASLSFALSVIFTMLSAQAFDSRLIWDRIEDADKPATPSTGASSPRQEDAYS